MRKDKKDQKIVTCHFVSPGGVRGEAIYDPNKRSTRFIADIEGKLTAIDNYKENSIVYAPYTPRNPLLTSNVIKLPSALGESKSPEELIESIGEFIKKYLFLPEDFLDIAIHYVLLTWSYEEFNEVPYLRVRGDYGTGKTRFLQVIGSICYRPISASGASTVSPIFHLLDKVRGTLILDEADFIFSSETSEIVKILNNGNAKGFSVLRCETNKHKEFRPVSFNVFGPKILATRKNYQDDALESRCITLDTNFPIPPNQFLITLPSDFEEEARQLRNCLLRWRLTCNSISPTLRPITELSARSSQIFSPLLAIARDRRTRDRILSFAVKSMYQQKVDRGLTEEADVLRVIQSLVKKSKSLSISNIYRLFLQRFSKYYDRRITPKWIGSIVRTKLQLSTRKSNGQYILSENQEERLKKLYDKFDLV